jgi:hypothetical protein
MENETMGKITILLSNEADKILRERAKKNLRSISKEVEYILLNLIKDKEK